MRLITGLFTFFSALIFSVLGVLLVFMEKKDIYNTFDTYYQQFLAEAPPFDYYREAFGGVLAGIAVLYLLLVFLAWVHRRRERVISFVGTEGEAFIDLEPVEATLEKVAARLPEVHYVKIHMKPLKGDGRVLVSATGILKKEPDDDARMVIARVQNFIKLHARKITGLQNIDATLRVRKWRMSVKSIKMEPLMLEAPDGQPEMGITTIEPANDAHKEPYPTDTDQEVPVEPVESKEQDYSLSKEDAPKYQS